MHYCAMSCLVRHSLLVSCGASQALGTNLVECLPHPFSSTIKTIKLYRAFVIELNSMQHYKA